MPWQDNDRYLQDRMVETLGIGYQDHWPFRQADDRPRREEKRASRPARGGGACFGESAGLGAPELVRAARAERLRTNTAGGVKIGSPTTPRNTPRCASASACSSSPRSPNSWCRARRGEGPQPHRDGQCRCRRSAAASIPNFSMRAAGIEADLTITRLAADRFLVVTAAFTQTHVEAWITELRSPRMRSAW